MGQWEDIEKHILEEAEKQALEVLDIEPTLSCLAQQMLRKKRAKPGKAVPPLLIPAVVLGVAARAAQRRGVSRHMFLSLAAAIWSDESRRPRTFEYCRRIRKSCIGCHRDKKNSDDVLKITQFFKEEEKTGSI